MSGTLRVACVQLTSRSDKAANLERTEPLVAKAAAAGSDVVVLPEKWNAIGDRDQLHAAAETLEGGESVEAMARWARTHGITLVGGSITERREGREKLSNTSVVFDPEGTIVGVYRKIHMFDVEVGGHVYRESDAEEPGDEPVVVEVEGWTAGLTVCYDVRFPELYRILALQGARGREPVLRGRGGADRRDASGPPQLRPLADRGPVGDRRRDGTRRGDGDRR
jgi:deaminated glutathione amidase